jgi:hypothetical protein
VAVGDDVEQAAAVKLGRSPPRVVGVGVDRVVPARGGLLLFEPALPPLCQGSNEAGRRVSEYTYVGVRTCSVGPLPTM